MKTLKSVTTSMFLLLSVFGTSIVVNPQEATARKACANESLSGTYQLQGDGVLDGKPYALHLLDTFDGTGKIAGTVLVRSIGGTITTDLSNQGTYQVNGDCSVTVNFTRADGTTANYKGVVYDNGNKLGLTQIDNNSVVTLTGERVTKSNRYR